MVTITEYLEANIKIRTKNSLINLTEEDQRVLLVWFKNNKPELWQEIFCDNCPEVC